MKKIIFWTFLAICVVIASVFIRIITVDVWDTDCMIQYVLSDEKYWYMYKIDEHMYHIDTQDYNWLEKIWESRWCIMLPYKKEFSFMAMSNTLYCSVVSVMSFKNIYKSLE